MPRIWQLKSLVSICTYISDIQGDSIIVVQTVKGGFYVKNKTKTKEEKEERIFSYSAPFSIRSNLKIYLWELG